MLSLSALYGLNQEAGRRAAQAQRLPYVIANQEEIDSYDRLPFPNLGYYVPTGWRETQRFFLDKSGRGDGLALGLRELKARLKPGCGYAIVEEGEFQAYTGEFVQDADAPGNAAAFEALEPDAEG